MALTDGLGRAHPQYGASGAVYLLDALGVLTATGNITLTSGYRQLLRIDPGGAARDVLLPPEEHGLWFVVANAADAAENLVLKDDSGTTTIVTANQNEAALVWCDGTDWHLVALFTAPAS